MFENFRDTSQFQNFYVLTPLLTEGQRCFSAPWLGNPALGFFASTYLHIYDLHFAEPLERHFLE